MASKKKMKQTQTNNVKQHWIAIGYKFHNA